MGFLGIKSKAEKIAEKKSEIQYGIKRINDCRSYGDLERLVSNKTFFEIHFKHWEVRNAFQKVIDKMYPPYSGLNEKREILMLWKKSLPTSSKDWKEAVETLYKEIQKEINLQKNTGYTFSTNRLKEIMKAPIYKFMPEKFKRKLVQKIEKSNKLSIRKELARCGIIPTRENYKIEESKQKIKPEQTQPTQRDILEKRILKAKSEYEKIGQEIISNKRAMKSAQGEKLSELIERNNILREKYHELNKQIGEMERNFYNFS